ncbi:MAG: sulfurtransferase [Alphaproteobacteria bacterium]
MHTHSNALIDPDELLLLHGRDQVKLLDASWVMAGKGETGRQLYEKQHIIGSHFFDIDLVADHSTHLPHMIPAATVFEEYVGNLGIRADDHVVIYDHWGFASAAARVWWMFRLFGHRGSINILDGGLPAWIKKGGHVSNVVEQPPIKQHYMAHFQPHLLKTRQQVEENINNGHFLLLDARSPERFSGQAPEPWPNRAMGHIKGSINLFFQEMINRETGQLKSRDDLRAILAKTGIDLHQPIAITCGSGVTACVLGLALYEIGQQDAAIYDGSWAEWGLIL